jgi:hypothetical protein
VIDESSGSDAGRSRHCPAVPEGNGFAKGCVPFNYPNAVYLSPS